MKYMKMYEEYKSIDRVYDFPIDISELQKIIENLFDKIGIEYVSTETSYGGIMIDGYGYHYSIKGVLFSIDLTHRITDDNTVNAIVVPLMGESGHFANMGELFNFIARVYGIDMGKVMLKMNENIDDDDDDYLSDDIDDVQRRIENYLNKVGIKYDKRTVYDDMSGYSTKSIKYSIIGYDSFFFLKKYEDSITQISAWFNEATRASHIHRMSEFIKYLTDLAKIDMGEVMLKMNEEYEEYTFPNNIKEFQELIENYLDKV